jgi:23S rRNA (cytosine1962-C5)-methyltransferase
MFLKGAIRLKKGPSRFLRSSSPWVFSNELVKIDKSLAPGSWVSLEAHDGRALGYGFFNPHSLIAFRAFERVSFRSEEQTRAVFFKRLDGAWAARQRAYGAQIAAREMGAHSFRLAFGESDGVPGFIIDLYEATPGALAVLQSHAAGADSFLFWAQQWLAERMAIDRGVIRNDVDVRRKENVALEVKEWGSLPKEAHALEGGVRFFVDPRRGQKTGYFYDHRDNRAELARRAAGVAGDVLDCFSYVGSWGLQALKRSPKAKLVAIDVSAAALSALSRNAEENGFKGRVECVEMDFFKDGPGHLGDRRFGVVVCDPPALTSSAKQAQEGRRAHETCFRRALEHLAPGGLFAAASCSFHLTWDEFLECGGKAGGALGKQLRATFVGSQAADHPVLASMPETRYLKCMIAEEIVP